MARANFGPARSNLAEVPASAGLHETVPISGGSAKLKQK
jgi:hypothetical protein